MSYGSYVKTIFAKGHAYHYLRPPLHLRAQGVRSVRLVTEDPVAEAAAIIERALSTEPDNQQRFERHVRVIYRKAFRHAQDRGIPFAISYEDISAALDRSKLKCEVTGIAFRMVVDHNGYRQPFRPSLDRIDASRGYTPDNIRMVCVAVNTAMADWGEEVFWAVVHAAKRRKPRTVTKREVLNRPVKIAKPGGAE
ncbi:hypothetical protein [Methylobacterium soli]|uniref:Uncharacterized protein n=1 Tax=Methylobacterium soli TaxID=553447 RepID=A0A6L3T345_9HYPH|nr:hypothetical protein [Methylobacterium soli]KAB1079367.1 hypothetical protein F6X53_11205 [Methylobacterium soli]GJE44181.1 hypothetical protein AEGHOMDF_3367 [Methylobacterium soli]